MHKTMTIAGRVIGSDQPPYLIAELSGNHKGELDRVFKLIDMAKASGADAVKIQTYTADTITIDHDGPGFFIEGGLWKGRTLHNLYQEAHTPWEWHASIFAYAAKVGIPVFSSPFDPSAVDLLAELGAPAYKIASFEIVDLPLIRYVAQQGKPVIVSTGMASLGEIEEVVTLLRDMGTSFALLHCTSGYPTPPQDSALRTIAHMAQTFRTVVGLSDHSHGIAVPVAATALGANIIEKHFTLSRAEGGVDADFSLEPAEFAAMAESCRTAWQALGQIDYGLKPSEKAAVYGRRSLYVVQDVRAGETLTPKTVRSIRPGYGLPPKYLPDILGKVASRDLKKGEPLAWSMLAD